MIEFYSNLKGEFIFAFINTDKGWLAFTLFCSSILAIFLIIFWKKRSKDKILIFGYILFLICFFLVGCSFIMLLLLLPRTFGLLMSIIIIGFILIYSPRGLLKYFKNEKLPRPWWKSFGNNNF